MLLPTKQTRFPFLKTDSETGWEKQSAEFKTNNERNTFSATFFIISFLNISLLINYLLFKTPDMKQVILHYHFSETGQLALPLL
jgi:hypothetical protein